MEIISSFCLLHLMEVSALTKLQRVCLNLVVVKFMGCENVNFRSSVISILFEYLVCQSDRVGVKRVVLLSSSGRS